MKKFSYNKILYDLCGVKGNNLASAVQQSVSGLCYTHISSYCFKTMDLTSVEYSKLLSWLAYYKHHTILNKTQMQKLLFMCYGIYYALEDKPLFKDDTPKAWPYGPVFPRVNVRYNPNVLPSDLSTEEKKAFLENEKALRIANSVIVKNVNVSAHALSEWSHEKGSPWFTTVYGEDGSNKNINWNKQIPDSLIKAYFKEWIKRSKIKA